MDTSIQKKTLTDRICDIDNYAELLNELKRIEPYLPSEEESMRLRLHLADLPKEIEINGVFDTEKEKEVIRKSMYAEEFERTNKVILPGSDLRYGFYWALAMWYAGNDRNKLKEWGRKSSFILGFFLF